MILTELTRNSITTLIDSGVKVGNYLRDNYGTYEKIGEGGFGTVYKIRRIQSSSDTDYLGDIALKRISLDFESNYSYEGMYPRTSLRDQSTLEHFLQCCQEAVLQSETFDHPNIVRVYDKWIQQTPNTMTAERLSEDFLTIFGYLEPVDASKPRLEKTKLAQHKALNDALVETKGLSFFRTLDKGSNVEQDGNREPTQRLTMEHMRELMKVGDDEYYLEDSYTIGEKIGESSSPKVFNVTVDELRREYLYPNASQQIVLERIDLDYENDYKSDSYNIISSNDETKLRRFLDYCKKAVFQPIHPNAVRIYENWIQKTPLFNRPEELDDPFTTVKEYFESPNYPSFKSGDGQALASINGLSLYLTMELYDEDLKTWLRKKRRDKEEEELNDLSRTIFGDIVCGLKYVHDQQYIHVDLKPENILIKYDSDLEIYTAALSDFGLSRLVTTPPEDIADTKYKPSNLAPDQFFSCKFDLWSLGLIMYQMTTKCNVPDDDLRLLKLKARDKNPQKLQEFLQTTPQSISANEHLQQTFHHMITQCLQSHETRYNASDFDENNPW